MTGRKKNFDCVEMKNRIQRELREEYEARKDEFPDYLSFINATFLDSPQMREFYERVSRAQDGRTR